MKNSKEAITMETQTLKSSTAKMIYADQKVARMIMGKVAKSNPARQFTLVHIPTGWQISPIHKMPSAMPPAKPLPVKKSFPSMNPLTGADVDVLSFTLPLVKETDKWFLYWGADNVTKVWLYKGHLINYVVETQNDGNPNKLRFTVTQKIAKKLGLDKPAKSKAEMEAEAAAELAWEAKHS